MSKIDDLEALCGNLNILKFSQKKPKNIYFSILMLLFFILFLYQSNCKLQVYYIICQQKLNSIYSNVIICFILTPFLTLPSQPFLPSPFKLQNFTTPNESLMNVCCGCVQIWHLFHTRDRRYRFEINFCVFH